jgi:hypothetical protein
LCASHEPPRPRPLAVPSLPALVRSRGGWPHRGPFY